MSDATTRAAGDDLPSIDFGQMMQTTRMCFATVCRRDAPAERLLNGVSVHALGLPSAEMAMAAPRCPFCTSSIISPSSGTRATTVLLNTMPRRYTPRCEVRKQNRLAAWFKTYGYIGPKYCRACSEAFASHLLRQAIRGTKSKCSRSHPCDHCNSILSHFECTPEDLYTKADVANSAPTPKARKFQRGLNHVEDSPRVGSSGAAVDVPPAQMNSSKRLRCVKAFSTVAFVVGALVVVGGYGNSASVPLRTIFDPSARRDDPGPWTCPAVPAQDALSETSSTSPLAVSVYSPEICDGESSAHVFACDVDECKSGLLPVGHRLCRCDGCIHAGGRCGGWTLLGQGRRLRSDSAAVCERGTDSTAWPDSVVSDSFDEMPSDDSHPDVIMWSAPSSKGTERVWLFSFGSLATRVPASWTGSSVGAKQNRTGEVAATELLSDDVGGAVGGQEFTIVNSSGQQMLIDTTTLWYFELETGSWERQILPGGPGYRSSSAWWSDSTGALFIFGGLLAGPSGGELQENLTDTGGLWRLDTVTQVWRQILCARTSEHNITAGLDDGIIAAKHVSLTQACQLWPSPRLAHTMWSEYNNVTATSKEQQQCVWMFGGHGIAGDLEGGLQFSLDAATQLWRLSYRYSRSGGKVTELRWQLVTAQAHASPIEEKSDGAAMHEPIYACQDGFNGDKTLRDCPVGRTEAGSWRANARRGGWVFGGYSWAFVDIMGVYVMDDQLSDLWYFNGDIENPQWQQYLARADETRASGTALWPPAWSSATGWEAASSTVDDAGAELKTRGEGPSEKNGEIWLVGGTGKQDAFGEDVPGTASMWRFSIASGSWESMRLEGNDVQAWPAPRSRASAVALEGGRRGLLFGGVGQLECEPERATTADKGVGARRSLGYARGEEPIHTGRLSSLWRWDSWA